MKMNVMHQISVYVLFLCVIDTPFSRDITMNTDNYAQSFITLASKRSSPI